MAPFRFNALNGALTYPQVGDVSKQLVYDTLISKTHGSGTSIITVDKLLVGQEEHEDGGIHFHVYIRFSKKPDIRSSDFFDVAEQHPNIQGCRSVKDWVKYCTKEDKEPLANYSWNTPPGRTALAAMVIREMIEVDKPINEIIDAAIDQDANLIKCMSSVTAYINARKRKQNRCAPERALMDFRLCDEACLMLFAWKSLAETMNRGDRRSGVQSLWITGETKLGKTSLARSLGFHWYMQNHWSLDNYSDDEHTYGVIDDVPWETLKRHYKALLGCQKDVTYTDKYRSKTTVSGGYPIIVCSNDLPEFDEAEKRWLLGNVHFYVIRESLIDGDNVKLEPILYL